MSAPKNLSDLLPVELQPAEAQKVADWLNTDLTIHGVRELAGENGVYVRLVVSLVGEDETFVIACGAAQVMDVVTYLKANKLFPVNGRFSKVGRAIILS